LSQSEELPGQGSGHIEIAIKEIDNSGANEELRNERRGRAELIRQLQRPLQVCLELWRCKAAPFS